MSSKSLSTLDYYLAFFMRILICLSLFQFQSSFMLVLVLNNGHHQATSSGGKRGGGGRDFQ